MNHVNRIFNEKTRIEEFNSIAPGVELHQLDNDDIWAVSKDAGFHPVYLGCENTPSLGVIAIYELSRLSEVDYSVATALCEAEPASPTSNDVYYPAPGYRVIASNVMMFSGDNTACGWYIEDDHQHFIASEDYSSAWEACQLAARFHKEMYSQVDLQAVLVEAKRFSQKSTYSNDSATLIVDETRPMVKVGHNEERATRVPA